MSKALARGSSIFSRAILSVQHRIRMARFGIFYFRGRTLDIRVVRIRERTIKVALPDTDERPAQLSELIQLIFLDCYCLSLVRQPVLTVLDVGANIGLFALAARRAFPDAKIHCYEPNKDLEATLSYHCSAVQADYFVAAVGASAGRVSLHRNGNSLTCTSYATPDGDTEEVAFADAVARLGNIDLLKLDCEGAEWDIFSNSLPWVSIRHVTMEYHLWAKPFSTVEDVRCQLRQLGFSEVIIKPLDDTCGFAWARKPEKVSAAQNKSPLRYCL